MRDFHKMKLYCLLQIFRDYTDEQHGITMPEIIEKLALYDIQAERKGIYRDIACINAFGMDKIIKKRMKGGKSEYRLEQHLFSMEELQFLTDAVRASASLSNEEAEQLTHKIGSLGSRYCAKDLARQTRRSIPVMRREPLLPSMRLMMQAIREHRSVCFRYLVWNTERRLEPGQMGKTIQAIPLAFVWKDSYYYVAARTLDTSEKCLYRMDRLLGVRIEDSADIEDTFDAAHTADAADGNDIPAVRGQEAMTLQLRTGADAAGALLDRFGADIPMIPNQNGGFDTRVRAESTESLLCWLVSLKSVRVTGPEEAVERMRGIAARLNQQYG